jgi:WD40 repeat protein
MDDDSEAAKDRTEDNVASNGEADVGAPDGNAPAVAPKPRSPASVVVNSPTPAAKKNDFSFIVTGSLDDKLKIWDWEGDELTLRETLDGHYLGIVSVDISRDSKRKFYQRHRCLILGLLL